MADPAEPRIVDLPMQRPQRERLIHGVETIIHRMTRVSPAGNLCLVDHDARSMSIAIIAYLEGRPYEC